MEKAWKGQQAIGRSDSTRILESQEETIHFETEKGKIYVIEPAKKSPTTWIAADLNDKPNDRPGLPAGIDLSIGIAPLQALTEIRESGLVHPGFESYHIDVLIQEELFIVWTTHS